MRSKRNKRSYRQTAARGGRLLDHPVFAVAVFHIYTLTAGRKYDSVSARHFKTEEETIRFAETLLTDHHAVEVWAGDRLVFQASRARRH
jgi:hypothetical protein